MCETIRTKILGGEIGIRINELVISSESTSEYDEESMLSLLESKLQLGFVFGGSGGAGDGSTSSATASSSSSSSSKVPKEGLAPVVFDDALTQRLKAAYWRWKREGRYQDSSGKEYEDKSEKVKRLIPKITAINAVYVEVK